jgi:hypothetical protein
VSRWVGSMMVVSTCFAAAAPKAVAQVACTGEWVPAVVVRIRDDKTGAPLAESALAVVKEKEYADTLDPFEYTKEGLLRSRQGAGERAGTYDVIVTRRGYSPWQAHAVKVERDECHVKPAYLEARLERLP